MDKDRVSARFALMGKPAPHQYAGLSYEQASRRAQAICQIAGETGQTVNASYHLAECRRVMELRDCRAN